MPDRLRPLLIPCALAIAAVLPACSSTPAPLYQQEQFDASGSPYARTFHAKSDATCEAARRALLSQGYIANASGANAVDGSKNFQPTTDSHIVIEFHIVCADASADGTSSIAYVNAVQDRYTLKKTNTSASVGLSVFGSLSLPIGSSDDSMVKIASETIPAGVFYERYFNLVDHFLKIDPAQHSRAIVKAAEKEHVAPLPEPGPATQGEPGKMTTPVTPTPAVPALPGTASAASAPAAASSPATANTPAATSAPASGNAPTPASTTPNTSASQDKPAPASAAAPATPPANAPAATKPAASPNPAAPAAASAPSPASTTGTN